MNNKLKKVVVVFENCDTVELKSSWIDILTLEGIHLQHYFDNIDYSATYVNMIVRYNEKNQEVFEQLYKRKDITHLHLYYKNGKDYYISVPEPSFAVCWWDNPYQINEIENTEYDDLFLDITIKKHWSLMLLKTKLRDIKHNFKFYYYSFKSTVLESIRHFFRWK